MIVCHENEQCLKWMLVDRSPLSSRSSVVVGIVFGADLDDNTNT
jgi:hypothetical protein